MFDLTPRCAFDGLLHPVGADPQVWVQAVQGFALASVLARPGAGAELPLRVRQLYGVDLPAGAMRAAKEAAFIGVGPGAWLALSETPHALAGLETDLGHLAVVIDQSGGRGFLRIGGPGAAAVLAKGVFIDLHPAAFPVGSAAAANLAHVAVDLWRTGPETFELLVPRSFCPAAAHWLLTASAGLGLALRV